MFSERDSVRKNSIALGTFALITGTLLATTNLATKDKIAEAQRQAEQKALLEIIPMEHHSNDLLMDVLPVPEHFWPTLGLENGGNIHVARDEAGNATAWILPTVAHDGYSGDIKLIIGINSDGTIAGVRVTEHNETPGLGDKIDLKKSRWILDFNGKSLHNPSTDGWKVKKDKGEFDQLTGATITPRAVVQQAARALQYYAEDKARLLKAAEHPQAKTNSTESNNHVN